MPLRRSPALRHLLDVCFEIVKTLHDSGAHTIEDDSDPLYAQLKDAIESITPLSLRLRMPIHSEILPHMPPTVIRYLEVFENPTVSIGIFVLPPRGKIPLHGQYACVCVFVWRSGMCV
jgi:hypothetical protein